MTYFELCALLCKTLNYVPEHVIAVLNDTQVRFAVILGESQYLLVKDLVKWDINDLTANGRDRILGGVVYKFPVDK